MKKILVGLIGLSMATAAAAQAPPPVTVAPSAIRMHAERVETGFVTWVVTTAGGIVIPPCATGATTFRGAGLVGHFAGRHNSVTTAVWDKDALLAVQAAQIAAGGTGEMFVRLQNSINLSNFTSTVKAVVADPGLVRVLLQGYGPLPVPTLQLGNNGLNLIANAVEQSAMGVSGTVPTSVRTNPATLGLITSAVGTYLLPLGGGGGGSLDVCLGPTGQVRMIHEDNNGDWATECVANGWRAETIQLGAGSAFATALNAPNVGALSTFTANCALAFGSPTAGPVTIANPIALSLSQVDAENIQHRTHAFFFGGGGNALQVNSTNPAPGLPKLRIEIQ